MPSITQPTCSLLSKIHVASRPLEWSSQKLSTDCHIVSTLQDCDGCGGMRTKMDSGFDSYFLFIPFLALNSVWFDSVSSKKKDRFYNNNCTSSAKVWSFSWCYQIFCQRPLHRVGWGLVEGATTVAIRSPKKEGGKKYEVKLGWKNFKKIFSYNTTP